MRTMFGVDDNLHLATAIAAIRAGDIPAARRALDARLTETDDPDAHLLAGILAFVLCESEVAVPRLDAAFRGYRSTGANRRAALTASFLGRVFFDGLGNRAAANGWFARAERLLGDDVACPERGWLAVALVGCSIADADELDRRAALALKIARELDDVELECKALADSGLAMVSQGRIDEGMVRLDEAMAIVTSGECTNPVVSGTALCCLLSACERAGDLRRAEEWTRALEAMNFLTLDQPLFFSHCRTAYGTVLCDMGRWTEAEAALRVGLQMGRDLHSLVRHMNRGALADLWIRQGRLDDAERLLAGYEDRVETLVPIAHLHLARHRLELASAVARQALRMLGGDRMRSAPLLLCIIDAELGRRNPEAAAAAADRLHGLATDRPVPLLLGQAALGSARVAISAGDCAVAVGALDAGLRSLGDVDAPLLRAALHLEMARAHVSIDPGVAIAEARVAFGLYQRIGSPLAAHAADILNDLGISVHHTPRRVDATSALTNREREVFSLIGLAKSNAEIAARLYISVRTVETHVSSILAKLGLRSRAEAAIYTLSLSDPAVTVAPIAR
jgi:DNA-binding CsgD family transcriptional regulator